MISYILNIVLQMIECLICFFFYETISDKKGNYIKRLLVLIFSYLIMFGINIIFDYNVVINTIVMVTFHILFAFFLYNQKLVFSLVYAVIITSLVTITEISAINLVAVVFNTDSKSFIENTLNYIIVIVFSKSLFFIVLKIIGDIINRYRQNEKAKLIYLFYPFSLLLILTAFVVISYKYQLSNEIKLFLSLSIIILTFSVLATCVFQQLSAKKELELNELRATSQRQELDNTYFELLENQNEELQIFVHDIKNHLSNIYSLSDDSLKTKAYIEGIVNDIDSANQIGKTKNKLLDLIIKKYDFICHKKGITFEKNIHTSNLDRISDSDLTAIFNNLLDNAVEAAQKSAKKHIVLNINNFGDIIHVDFQNSCDEAPIVKNHNLISIKNDRKAHGYGYKSVSRTVKKYNGDIEWQYDGKERIFSVSIIF